MITIDAIKGLPLKQLAVPFWLAIVLYKCTSVLHMFCYHSCLSLQFLEPEWICSGFSGRLVSKQNACYSLTELHKSESERTVLNGYFNKSGCPKNKTINDLPLPFKHAIWRTAAKWPGLCSTGVVSFVICTLCFHFACKTHDHRKLDNQCKFKCGECIKFFSDTVQVH